MRRYLFFAFVLIFTAFNPVTGCFEGGANLNQKAPGNNTTGGVNLGGGSSSGDVQRRDIAVDPQGAYLLARMSDRLVLGHMNNRKVHTLSGVGTPERVAFAWKSPRFYVTTTGTNGGLYAVDSDTLSIVWQVSVDHLSSPRLYTSKDDLWLVVADDDKLEVFGTDKGTKVRSFDPGKDIADVDITEDSSKIIVTQEHRMKGGLPNTQLVLLDTHNGPTINIDVPNCSSHLVLDPSGDKAFLAPTQCGNDPVSVVDLKNTRFERNLPGFGPVALADGGATVVAFMDTLALDRTLFDDKSQIPSSRGARYRVMLIDAKTLKFRHAPVGDNLPRYAVSKNGKVVLVDSVWMGLKDRVRILDMTTLALHQVSGPEVFLNHFVLSPNNKDVYLLQESDLFQLSIPGRSVKALPTTVACQSLNMTLDGKTLFIMDWKDQVHLYNTATDKITGVMVLDKAGK